MGLLYYIVVCSRKPAVTVFVINVRLVYEMLKYFYECPRMKMAGWQAGRQVGRFFHYIYIEYYLKREKNIFSTI